jgi:PAS domain S-box-containing protein
LTHAPDPSTQLTQADYAAMVNSSSDAIVSTDAHGLITSWNPAAQSIYGYTQEEMLGQSQACLIPLDCVNTDIAAMARIERGLAAEPYTGIRIRKDGSFFPVACTTSPIRDSNGRIVGSVDISKDITAFQRQQAALRHSEETFRTAMEHAPIGMALVSPGGRWLNVNQALCDLLGYDRKVLLNMDAYASTHPDDVAQELELVRQALDGGIKKFQLEKRLYQRSGRLIWVELSMSLVQSDDQPLPYFIAQLHDITTRNEMDRMKSDFISVVSHELRTPLTSIRGSLGLILGAMRSEVSDKAGRLLGIAHSNCERLIVLINDILDIDKITSGEMPFDKTDTTLAPIVRLALDGSQAYAEQFGVTVRARALDDTLAATVDVGRLMQVLSNFLSNAIKLSPRDGLIEVELVQDNGQARIAVIDQGPGISEAFQERIFGKFMQEDASATRTKGGAGLGLHVGKQIVERMGGQIGFDTEIGVGTTFWLMLPCVAKPRQTIKSVGMGRHGNALTLAPTQTPRTNPLPRILHVEDDEDFALIVAESVHGRVEVVPARTVEHARHLLKQQAFDLLVLDVCMPDGTAVKLLDELASMGKADLPILILSAIDVSEELRRRVSGVLVKSRASESLVTRTITNMVYP